ncbi:hypothetical protein GN156_11640 [bacterium LRH843]|nr:hypothetical protein [bacterium LRH843]
MIDIRINKQITNSVPTFKIGAITYHHIAIGASPQMLKGRLQFFQEVLMIDLDSKDLSEVPGILEWRETMRLLQMNPDHTSPSHETLYRKIQKGLFFQSEHSAVDLNTFFTLQYAIPFGLYNLEAINGPIDIRLGTKADTYEGSDGVTHHASNTLISADQNGVFGSLVANSARTNVTTETKSALQLIYFRPSMEIAEANELMNAVGTMFTQVHGGDFTSMIVKT